MDRAVSSRGMSPIDPSGRLARASASAIMHEAMYTSSGPPGLEIYALDAGWRHRQDVVEIIDMCSTVDAHPDSLILRNELGNLLGDQFTAPRFFRTRHAVLQIEYQRIGARLGSEAAHENETDDYKRNRVT